MLGDYEFDFDQTAPLIQMNTFEYLHVCEK